MRVFDILILRQTTGFALKRCLMIMAEWLGIPVVPAGGIYLHQWRSNYVLEMVDPFICRGELGLGLSCLLVLLFGHTQLGDSALAGGVLETP